MKQIEKLDIASLDDVQEHYNYIHNRSGIRGEKQRYVKINKWALNILNVEPGKKILDVACGNGHLLSLAESLGLQTFGIDISTVAVTNASKRNKTSNIIVGAGEQIPFPQNYFDYVTCMGSLEHFISPEKGCREISRVLKKDGVSCIYVPNLFWIRFVINAWFKGEPPTQKQDNERFGTKQEWEEIFKENGLGVIKLRKFNLMPINLSYGFTFLCKKI